MSTPSNQPVIHIRPQRPVGILSLTEIWKFRVLLAQMINRNIRSRILSSPISIVWGFIRPAIMAFALVFIRNMSAANLGAQIPYPLFIFSGLCFWFLWAEMVIQSAGSLRLDSGISKKVYFPLILSPIAVIASRWVDIFIISAAVIAFQLYLGVPLSWDILAMVPVTAVMFLLAFGIGVLFSALYLIHQDNSKFLETAVYLGLFLSPVLFSKEILPEVIQTYYNLNPMVGVLTGLRGALFGPEHVDWTSLGVSAIMAVGFTMVGLLLLDRVAKSYAERV